MYLQPFYSPAEKRGSLYVASQQPNVRGLFFNGLKMKLNQLAVSSRHNFKCGVDWSLHALLPEVSGQLGCSQSWGTFPKCSLDTFYTDQEIILWSCAYESVLFQKKAFLPFILSNPKTFLSCCFCVCNITLPLVLTNTPIEFIAFSHLVFSECAN